MEDIELYEVDTIIVSEDDGTETEYAVLDKFEFEGKKYAILAEVVNEDVSEDEFVFLYEEDDGEMIISSIEDDAEFTRVSEYYDSLSCEE